MHLGKVAPADARRRMAEVEGLSAEQKTALEGLIFDSEVMQMARGAGQDPAKIAEVGKTFLEWSKAGKVPAEKSVRQTFWYYALMSAESARDADGLETALGKFSEVAGDDPRTAKFIADKKEKLKELRGGK